MSAQINNQLKHHLIMCSPLQSLLLMELINWRPRYDVQPTSIVSSQLLWWNCKQTQGGRLILNHIIIFWAWCSDLTWHDGITRVHVTSIFTSLGYVSSNLDDFLKKVLTHEPREDIMLNTYNGWVQKVSNMWSLLFYVYICYKIFYSL